MKVIIVEDSEVVRASLCGMLSGIPGVEIVAQAADEAGALSRINSLQPDVVILDLHLQQGSGLNVLLNIKQNQFAGKVIVLSNYASEPYISRCKNAGADYFLDKSFQFMLVADVLKHLIFADVQNSLEPNQLYFNGVI